MRMHGRHLGSIVALAAGAWIGMACGFSGGLPTVPGVAAQGSLTSPAGQPRVTAPGGLRGRGVRGYRKFRRPRARAR